MTEISRLGIILGQYQQVLEDNENRLYSLAHEAQYYREYQDELGCGVLSSLEERRRKQYQICDRIAKGGTTELRRYRALLEEEYQLMNSILDEQKQILQRADYCFDKY